MAKIHHNTVKKAKLFGVTMTVSDVDGEIIAVKNGVELARHLSGSVCLEQAIQRGQLDTSHGPKSQKELNGAAPAKVAKPKKARKVQDEDQEDFAGEGDEDGEDEDNGRSVVKKFYKAKYRPHKATCGDELVQLVKAHISVKDDETGETRIDPVKLRRFARANDCWVPAYAGLNIGMQRMNTDNRLRAKVRKGHDIVWA